MTILFLNCRLIDGSGGPSSVKSVVVDPPKIRAIVDFPALSQNEQAQLVEASDRIVDCESRYVVAPGFIDMHAHSDLGVLHTPSHLAKITQGVTTEVLGQDGIGYAPVNDECLAHIRQQIQGWNGNPSDPSFWAWRSVKEYLDHLDKSQIATNAAFLVPQGNLRMLVLGYDPREPTKAEIAKMQDILRQSLREGAVGMSSGLTYVPGMYASDSELAQLLPIVAEHGGYYCPHHRSYGKGALRAYQEMIDLAKLTGIRLHLTHAILNFEENKNSAPQFLEMLKRGRENGVTITLDSYPYLPGSTTLAAQLPSWSAEGGPEQTLVNLQTPEVLEKIRYGVEVIGTDGCHGCTVDWSTIEISGISNPELKPYVGKRIAEIAELESVSGFDAMIKILIADRLATTILQHVGHEENVRAIMQDKFHSGGSDSILTSAKPHPRGHGCFTRYLGHYARELPQGKQRDIYTPTSDLEKYDSVPPYTVFEGGLEEAVAHLTGRSAAILQLADRGLVKPGYYADLVVFDPHTVRDTATFMRPEVYSSGIRSVLVNGEFAVDESEPTHARTGRTIRSVH